LEGGLGLHCGGGCVVCVFVFVYECRKYQSLI
jgi:hypothetical protein